MGRPLNKKYFVNNGTDPSKGLVLTSAWIVGKNVAESGYYIYKQSGTNRFHVTNGVDFGIVQLVSHNPTNAGQASMTIQNPQNQTEYVRTIYNNTVRTYSSNTYMWDFDGTGQVSLPIIDINDPVEPVDPGDPSETYYFKITAGQDADLSGYKLPNMGSLDDYNGDLEIKGIFVDKSTNLTTVQLGGDFTQGYWELKDGPMNNFTLWLEISSYKTLSGSEEIIVSDMPIILDFVGYDAATDTSTFEDCIWLAISGTNEFIKQPTKPKDAITLIMEDLEYMKFSAIKTYGDGTWVDH